MIYKDRIPIINTRLIECSEKVLPGEFSCIHSRIYWYIWNCYSAIGMCFITKFLLTVRLYKNAVHTLNHNWFQNHSWQDYLLIMASPPGLSILHITKASTCSVHAGTLTSKALEGGKIRKPWVVHYLKFTFLIVNKHFIHSVT